MRRIATVVLGVAAFFGILTVPASAHEGSNFTLVTLGKVNANAASADQWHSPAPPGKNGLIAL
ncbi:hypothetical protein [Streptomyces sp. NPDC051162]|uniref:hypothetical protein n=1 Tax=unclassified Streptomyces TaxID=2593676 RepID=UPI003421E075